MLQRKQSSELDPADCFFDPALSAFQSFADELTDDFYSQHYPGGDWTNVGQNYETLRTQAGEIISLIEQSLPQFFPKPPTK